MSERLAGKTALITGSTSNIGRAMADAISLGVIRDMAAGHSRAERMMAGTPAGVSGIPEAVAAAAVYLASDEAAFVHGTVIDVDGGRASVAVVAG
jgi:NAD(P)-dependent dehydrogenase (short-subunit alcohol dehydrogenase family)